MPRLLLPLLALVLAVGALVGGVGPMVRAQSDPTPAPTEYFPPYDRDYGSSGVMIVPLGAARLVEEEATGGEESVVAVQAKVVSVPAVPAVPEAEETRSTSLPDQGDLMLVQIRLDQDAVNPTPNEQEGSEVISVDTGAVAFTFQEVDGDALVIRGDPDDICAGGCPLSRVIAENGGEVVLLPGDRLIHNGPARYTYQLAPSVPIPAATSDGTGAASRGFAAPGALPGFACSGGCRARLTIACANGCRY